MIIRHGEKPDDSDLPGIDANGRPDDSSMTRVGWNRARALVGLFNPPQDRFRTGLARPRTIFAAGETTEGKGLRTRQTVAPLADTLKVAVDTRFGKGDEKALVSSVLSQPGPTLISWQHSEIPDIVEAFGGVSPAAPTEWAEERYDLVWVLTRTGTGWSFAQVPEMLLPGDKVTPIRG